MIDILRRLNAVVSEMRSTNVVSFGLKPSVLKRWVSDLESISRDIQAEIVEGTACDGSGKERMGESGKVHS